MEGFGKCLVRHQARRCSDIRSIGCQIGYRKQLEKMCIRHYALKTDQGSSRRGAVVNESD